MENNKEKLEKMIEELDKIHEDLKDKYQEKEEAKLAFETEKEEANEAIENIDLDLLKIENKYKNIDNEEIDDLFSEIEYKIHELKEDWDLENEEKE